MGDLDVPYQADRKCVLYFHWHKQISNQHSVLSFCYTLGNNTFHLCDFRTESVGDTFSHNWEAQTQLVRFLW